MDGQRFDAWTRAQATRLSRRTAGRVVAGAGAALAARAVGSSVSANGMCSHKGEFCTRKRDCCKELVCLLGECDECIEKGHLCDDDKQCCKGLACKHRECKKK